MAYGSFVIQHDLSLRRSSGARSSSIMGGSGSGKSTLLNHMVGLMTPARGDVLYDGESFSRAVGDERDRLRRRLGVSFQSGALLELHDPGGECRRCRCKPLPELPTQIQEIVSLKLALVGPRRLRGVLPVRDQRRHAQARRRGARDGARPGHPLLRRAVGRPRPPQLDAGSTTSSSSYARASGATMVVVTHELASIFAIADRAVFLDAETRTMIAFGPPKTLRDECPKRRCAPSSHAASRRQEDLA